jgi:hypothetical protein
MALRGDLASSLRSAVRYPWLRRTPRRPGWGYCVGIRVLVHLRIFVRKKAVIAPMMGLLEISTPIISMT